jgi:hypothetical protein
MTTVANERVRHRIDEGSPSKERVLESLKEQGIQDLETFAARAVQAHEASQSRPWADVMPEAATSGPDAALVERLFGREAQRDASTRPHRIPKLPFVVGDRSYEPSEIERFNGKPLHYVWDQDLIARGFVRAVVDRDDYRELVAPPPAGGGAAARSHVPGVWHAFFEHINFGGNVLTLAPRHAYADLTRVTMSGFWFWATSWNDQISSLRTGSASVTLCEHIINPILTGATMTVLPNTSVAWIGQAWNDRVSAILG